MRVCKWLGAVKCSVSMLEGFSASEMLCWTWTGWLQRGIKSAPEGGWMDVGVNVSSVNIGCHPKVVMLTLVWQGHFAWAAWGLLISTSGMGCLRGVPSPHTLHNRWYEYLYNTNTKIKMTPPVLASLLRAVVT